MLTVQTCQQHRLAVMHPNKAKSFPVAAVKLGHRRRGKRGTRSEERRNARRAHESKQKCRRWRSRGAVGVPHPTRRTNEDKNLRRKHLDMELSATGDICSENATEEAGGEEKRPLETQGRQGEVSAGEAHVRHVQRSHSSGQQC